MYIINETFTNGYNIDILNIISFLSIFCAIAVIISKNPIVSVLFLIGLFLNIACYLIILGMSFIGLSYLLVYVGAVSILFLFILMLINIRISELLNETRNSIPLVFIIALSFNSILYNILPSNISLFNDNNYSSYITKNKNDILWVINNSNWDNNLVETSHINSLGNIMYTNYSIWLIITSVILLLAMVGAIVITIKQKVIKELAQR